MTVAAGDDDITILDLFEMWREMGLGLLNIDVDHARTPLKQKSDQIPSLNPDRNAALSVALAARVRYALKVRRKKTALVKQTIKNPPSTTM